MIPCLYSHMVTQWKDAIDRYGLQIRKLVADSTNVGWSDNLADCIRDVNNDATENLIVLTTYDTFYRKDFIDIVKIAKSGLFWAAD